MLAPPWRGFAQILRIWRVPLAWRPNCYHRFTMTTPAITTPTAPLPASAERLPGLPEVHPELGKHLFSWRVPAITRVLNFGLVLLVVAALVFLMFSSIVGGLSLVRVAGTLSVVVLYAAVWGALKTPTGVDCSVYEKGIADQSRVLHFDQCRLGLESTKHFVQASSGGTPIETEQGFEVVLLQGEVDFRIKGYGPEYARLFDFFRQHVLPGFMARELARFEAGEAIRCGTLEVSQQGIRNSEGRQLSWDGLASARVEAGWIHLLDGQGTKVFETLVSNPNGYTLVEILTKRGILGG